jgi:hypothetical protein
MPTREYIRHPSNIPIGYSLEASVGKKQRKRRLKNVSEGGLCFISDRELELGNEIQISIPLCEPVFKAHGVVAWCQTLDEKHYDIGVEFLDESIHFTLRMVEQLCHIEEYRQQILEREGRELSTEEAAKEWISKYAGEFPQ